MHSAVRSHLTYANVTASLALFLAVGGISWAAATLPSNSVGTKQLKKNAVTEPKLKKGAVTGAKIKKGAVNSDKVKNGSLLPSDFQTPPTGPVGPQGPQGLTGPQGPAGPPGDPGVVDVVMRVVGPGAKQAFCGFGEIAVGGGGIVMGDGFLTESQPLPFANGETPTGWIVDAATADGSDASATAWVVCAGL